MPNFSIFTKLVIGAVSALFLLVGLSALMRGDYPVAIGAGVILAIVAFLAWIGIRSMRDAREKSAMSPEQRRQVIRSRNRWVAVLALISALLKVLAMRGHH